MTVNNNKIRKLQYIRYKNKNKKKYPSPKWKLVGKEFPFRWINTDAQLLEDSWVCDLGYEYCLRGVKIK